MPARVAGCPGAVVAELPEAGSPVGWAAAVPPFGVTCGAEAQPAISAARHSSGDSIRRTWSPQQLIRGDRDQSPVGQVGENPRKGEHGALVAEMHAYHAAGSGGRDGTANRRRAGVLP